MADRGRPEGVESEEAGRAEGRGRVASARQVLEDAGIDAPVRAIGVDGEIAAVTGSEALREPLARIAPRIQALGFRYVALELGTERRTRKHDT